MQISAVLDSLPYDNAHGGVWKQGFELSYSMTNFHEEDPLQVYVMPHSHNDPGEIGIHVCHNSMQLDKILMCEIHVYGLYIADLEPLLC